MIKSFCLTFSITLFSIFVFGQNTIRANRASYHVGEKIVVADSVSQVTFYNDSTTLLTLGSNKQASLAVLVKNNSAVGLKMLSSNAIVEVTGTIVLINGRPAILLSKREDFYLVNRPVAASTLTFTAN